MCKEGCAYAISKLYNAKKNTISYLEELYSRGWRIDE